VWGRHQRILHVERVDPACEHQLVYLPLAGKERIVVSSTRHVMIYNMPVHDLAFVAKEIQSAVSNSLCDHFSMASNQVV
jgi:hypothetical protein